MPKVGEQLLPLLPLFQRPCPKDGNTDFRNVYATNKGCNELEQGCCAVGHQ